MSDNKKTTVNDEDKQTIILMGDSVLDNFYWLEDKENDVRAQLQKKMPEYTVKNFAVDESTINSVLYGIKPANHYASERSYPYPTTNGIVYPIKLLENEQKTKLTKSNTHVVLSVGGNDGRVHLMKILWGADKLTNAILQGNVFSTKLEKLICEIIKSTPNLILIFVYKPHCSIFEEFKSQLGFGVQYLPIEKIIDFQGRVDQVYDSLRSVYLRLAKKYNIPLIDLSTTFDPSNRKHYGSTPIEPSNESGDVISYLIETVIKQNNDCSYYYSPNCNGKILTKSINK